MALPVLEKYRTEDLTRNKKFHYDLKGSLEHHREVDYDYYTCEIVADRDIEVNYTLGVVNHHDIIPKGSRGGRVWVDTYLAEQYIKYKKVSADFDFKGGLSQSGNCWVGPNCVIGPGSFVNDDAIVIKESKLINVHVGHRVVIDKSKIICPDPQISAVKMGNSHKILRGGMSSIMNDCKVSNSVIDDAFLHMGGFAKLLYTTLVRKDGCKGGLLMGENESLNHCNLKVTGNENISLSGKHITDKSIEGYGPYNGVNITVTKSITD